MLLLKNLYLKNLRSYKGRTVFLLIFSFLMSFSFFFGTIIVQGIKSSLKTVQNRLGADILVIPEKAKNDFDAQTVLIQAKPGYFYMASSKYDEICKVQGVEKASPQIFLASATAGCCSARLQLIGFDPSTDFTIQPWIKDSSKNTELGLLDVYIGNNITVNEDGFIRLYGNSCKIKGQFAATGSTLDNAVYMNYDTVKKLIESSFEKGLNQYEIFDTETVISSVFVKVKQGENIEEVAKRIQENVEGVSVATSKSMVSGIAENLKNVSKTANAFIVIFFFLSFFMTLLIFLMMINERKKEFATLISLGSDKKIIRNLIIKEALSVNLLGGTSAVLFCVIVLFAFRRAFTLAFNSGFILPEFYKIALVAILSLLATVVSSLISAALGIKKVSRMDAGLVLKEGE